MKDTMIFKYTIVLLFTVFTNNLIFSQCEADAGEALPPTDQICLNQFDASILIVEEWVTEPSNTPDYLFVISAPPDPENENKEFIIGTSEDGSFDFSDDGNGQPYPEATYSFTTFAYDQEEIDVVTNNLAVQFLLPGLKGGESLAEVLILVNESVLGPTTIENVADTVMTTIEAVVGFKPCVDIGSKYYVQFDYCTFMENIYTKEWQVFPTLVNVNQEINIISPQKGEFRIYDLNGKTISFETIMKGANSIQTPHVTSGYYIISLISADTVYNKRVFVR